MAGYANRVITKQFPELAEEGDTVWVTIRNPKTMSPGELRSKSGIKVSEDGQVEDTDETHNAGNEVLAKVVIGWRAYDATWVPEIDPDTGEPLPGQEQPRLTVPATPEQVAKLPMAIYMWLGEMIAAVNPQEATSDQEASTGKK